MLKNKKLRIEEGKKDISNFELAEKEGRVFLWGGVGASVSFCGSAGLVLQIDSHSIESSSVGLQPRATKASTKGLSSIKKQQVQKS